MTTNQLLWKVEEGTKVKLKDYDPGYTAKHIDQDQAKQELGQLAKAMSELQEALSASQHHSLLLILQGMDTSGKDGTIRHVFSTMNPQGCEVHAFKQPTPEELSHDFLWRVHKVAPPRGVLGVFNRSHYEDVLIVRVHNLVSEDIWQRRYKEINHFEKLLADNNTIILKFFLHISYEEQTKRLQSRIQEPGKAWKISAGDWTERKYWDDYQKAYEDALTQCSTDKAPWYIVPANRKWYRNFAIAHTLLETMRQYKDEWQAELEARGKRELEQLKKLQII